MPPTTAEGVKFCASCGDPADALDSEEHGPCCHALPHPWYCGNDGLYNRTSEPEPDEDEEGDDETVCPSCPHCGGVVWRVTATQLVDIEGTDGETVFYEYGAWDDIGARCNQCETEMPRHYELEYE